MDDTQDQDHYEERLKEVFNSFDASGAGSLCLEELSELCQSLCLDDATPALLHTLLQSQDRLTARVDFDQFRNALILVLSSTFESQQVEHDEEEEEETKPESPMIQPKFVKGSKRYGRRSTPEFIEPISDFCDVTNLVEGEADLEDNYDSAVPRKRERWNAHDSSTEEYEAEGQNHLWNPDEPSTPRAGVCPLSACLEERLRGACDELDISWDGYGTRSELVSLCEHLSLEMNVEVLQSLSRDGGMNVQEFVSRVVNNKPPTPSASTPYRQLKRHLSTQPFDEGGRRIATPAALTSTIGMRLFSTLDDGSGFSPVEYVLDAWMDEGLENSTEILQSLNFSLDGKLSLGDLTTALENELLVTKNSVHQAALVSFKAEIRHLLACVDRELREKEKLRSDLEKAEKLKIQLATEVDERHSAIEHMNNLNLRKLEQDHKEKLAAVRSELMKEMDQMQQQAGLQREELEAEVEKIRDDESFLRDHLSISVKENRRLEMELLDSTEKLLEAQSQNAKLQISLDNVMKEKFGDLDPGNAEFFLQEERMKELRNSHEAQYRELQDRIDELQSELQELHSLGRVHQTCHKPLSEELESKSPGMESDPGIGSEEVQPFSMTLEAEMMLEQLKEQHLQEVEDLQSQLQSKISELDEMLGKQRATHEDQKAALALQCQQEVRALREEMASIQSQGHELQSQLEQAELERTCLEQKRAKEREELESQHEEEVAALRQQLLEAHTCTADLEEQLKTLEAQQTETEEGLINEMDELRKRHTTEIKTLKEEHAVLCEARLEEERKKVQQKQAELQECEREQERLKQSHKDELEARLQEAKVKCEEEQGEIVQRLTEQWQKERAQLDERSNETLQEVLEEEMLRLLREQEEKEGKLRDQWERERAQLQEHQEEALLHRALQERLQVQEEFEQRETRLKGEWDRERLQLEEDYEGMLQERLSEERDKFETEKEEEQKRQGRLVVEERTRLEEKHQKALQELTAKHTEERDALRDMLDRLREDIAQERRAVEDSFTQRLMEVESRFSDDQDSVAERFQADVLRLEQHYQSELEALSQRHDELKLNWEVRMQEAEEEQKRAVEREQERLHQEWAQERQELESLYKEHMGELKVKNQHLQNELEDFISRARTKEIVLSRQLNDLHNRLQGTLETRDELLAQSEKKALDAELLLTQTVEDFKREREELLGVQSALKAKYDETLSISERQNSERIELMTERDGLKVKIKELEVMLQQAAVDFELERTERREHTCMLEEQLKDNPEEDRAEPTAERDELRTQEPETILNQVPSSAEKMQESNEVNNSMEETCLSVSSIQESDCLSSFLADENMVDKEHDEQVVATSDGQSNSMSQVHQTAAVPIDFLMLEADGHGDDLSSQQHSKNEPNKAVCRHMVCEALSSPQVFGENKVSPDSCEEENKPQDVPVWVKESVSHDDEPCHGTAVDPSALRETGDPHEPSLVGGDGVCEDSDRSLCELQALCHTATEENFLLQEKMCLLQQKTEILESLLAHHTEKINSSHQALEENHSLRVKVLLLTEHVTELELKALKMTDVHIRYEDCVCENAKLKEQNSRLEKRVWSLERRLSILHSLQAQHVSLEDEDDPLLDLQHSCEAFEKQNSRLRRAITQLQDESQSLNERTQAHRCEASRLTEENVALRQKIAALKEEDLKEVQEELEQTLQQLKTEEFAAQRAAESFQKQISELRLQSQQLEDENGMLSEKNVQSISDMENLRQQLAEMMKDNKGREALSHEEKNKLAACVSALEAELTKALEDTAHLEQRNSQLCQQLSGLREKAIKVKSMESQLSQLVDERRTVDKETQGLCSQLARAQEMVKMADESLQALNHQSARLKTDLHALQQERDSLKHEVAVLHKQMQNVSDKNQVLEMALHSTGLQSQSKKLYRDEMSRLLEQEQQLLRQENGRLQAEARSMKGDLVQSREMIRQLDATVLSLKHHKVQSGSSSLLKSLEEENASLKQELQAQKELTKACEAGRGQTELEGLQQENEALRTQMARLSSQLLETFQAQFVGLLPPSPHRMPRGQHRGEDLDNMQDERERKMKSMEERMREIELSLHNVKLLLKEKVAQLKEQLHRNGKADVLITNLYEENSQLEKALEATEQRKKIAEKKNYLLEEKISSLNKIVRDLNPSPLPSLPYYYKCTLSPAAPHHAK